MKVIVKLLKNCDTREVVDMVVDMEEGLPVLWRDPIASATIVNVRRAMLVAKDMAKSMEDMVRELFKLRIC